MPSLALLTISGIKVIMEPLTDVNKLSARAQFTALTLRESVARMQDSIPALPAADVNHLAPIADAAPGNPDEPQQAKFKVGIIGAGVAGLFTAMIFDELKERFELDVEYEILESRDNHVGGRLYTYQFPSADKDKQDKDKQDKARDHQYYDVGAMRFPDIPIMDR